MPETEEEEQQSSFRPIGVPRPYVTVRPGLEARISRPVFYELVALAQPERIDGRQVMGVWSEGVFFPIDETPFLNAAAG